MTEPAPKFQDLSQFTVPTGFRGRSVFIVQLWWFIQAVLFAPSPRILYSWRVLLLRCFGAKIGSGVKIRSSARVEYPWKLTIGMNAWIGERVQLYNLDHIYIGDNACISQDCYICTGSHDYSMRDFRYNCQPIRIGAECWVAAGSFVAPGVTIGRGAVIGARSLVMRDIDAATVNFGHPARRSKERLPVSP